MVEPQNAGIVEQSTAKQKARQPRQGNHRSAATKFTTAIEDEQHEWVVVLVLFLFIPLDSEATLTALTEMPEPSLDGSNRTLVYSTSSEAVVKHGSSKSVP